MVLRRIFCAFLVAIVFAMVMPISVDAAGEKVVLVELSGEIDQGQAALVLRGLSEAERINAKAFILQMDTFGGLVESATIIRDKITESKIPTICYIKNRAWSAGALIALAHEKIAIAPGGSIGAAEPIPTTEKTIAAVKAEFAATAKRTGRNPRVAEAMVDKTLGFKDYAKPGQILALTDYQALEVGIADFIASDREQLLEKLGLQGHEIEVVSRNWKETFTGVLASPAVKSVLLSIIILAILAEIKTAGMGVGAGIAIIAAALFFGSSFLVGLSGWLEPLLFFAGIVFIVVEFFIPGFGIFGIMGILSIVASFFLVLGGDTNAIIWLAVSVFLALVLFLLLLRRMPQSKFWSRFILKNSATKKAGFSSGPDYEKYLGREGVTITQLRPSGTADFAGEKLDVLTYGEFVEAGSKVVVDKAEGSKLFVKLL